MPIRHVYEKVRDKRKFEPHDYEITLEDGTIIGLPGTAWQLYRDTEKGDRVLIDFEYEPMPTSAQIWVFRTHTLVTHFGLNREYVRVAESK